MKKVHEVMSAMHGVLAAIAVMSASALSAFANPIFTIENGVLTGVELNGNTSVEVPAGVFSIGERAFERCSGLSRVVIPEGVTNIGDYAFMMCSELINVTLPDTLTDIGDAAFFGCTSLDGIVVPGSVRRIGVAAFQACTVLSALTIEHGVCMIDSYAFRNCIGLTSVLIPDSVVEVGSGAFTGCTSLRSVTMPRTAYLPHNDAFYGCNDSLIIIYTGAEPPAIENDDFAEAVLLAGVSGETTGTNVGATIDNGEHSYAYGDDEIVGEVWWKWTAPASGSVAFGTHDSNYDTSIAVYTGDVLENLELVASDDDYYDDYTSRVEFEAEYGATYYIAVGGYGTGNIRLSWSMEEREPIFDIQDGILVGVDLNGCTSVTIPSSVTSIGSYAFYNCSGLTSVTIPDSVTSIEQAAFSGCRGLTSVTFPDSVTSIGRFAFSGCRGLTSVTIPDSVTSIRSQAFMDCSGLLSITVGSGNAHYTSANGLLLSKDGTTLIEGVNGDVTIPGSVTSIGSCAFMGRSGLTGVTIPNSVTSIGSSAFWYCSGLTNVTIPDSVTSIWGDAFYGCSGLTSVTIPDSVTNIGESAFSGCSGLADEDGFVIIRSVLYGYFGNATQVTIPDIVTVIGDSAFARCSGLTSVAIPDSVTSIGERAFNNCSGLTSVTISDSVASVGSEAFSGCSPELYDTTTIPGVELVDGWVVGYTSSLSDSLNLTGVRGITCEAFRGCDYFTNVTIPDSVTSIGDYAFESCSGLTSVTLPDSVTSIGEGAFIYCGLTSVAIPDSVTNIGDYAFEGCRELTSVTIPDSVTNIGDYAFEGCSELTSVAIPDSVTSIGERAFYNCSGLTSVTIPDSVTSIGDYAFGGCENLTSASIPQVLCQGPDSGMIFIWAGFEYVTNLVVNGGVTNIRDYAFEGCRELTSVTIPNSVTNIGDYAFEGCSELTSVAIPDSVTSIGEGAFAYCENLEEVVFEGDTDGIEMNVFAAFEGTPWLESYFVSLLDLENDDFAGAVVLAGVSGETTGTNVGATIDNGEHSYAYGDDEIVGEVWWKWTASASGSVAFGTHDSNYDTSIAVYTGDVLENLELVASDDDYYDDCTSRVEFNAVASTTYYIAVGGYGTGIIRLSWSMEEREPFDIQDGILVGVDLNGCTDVTIPSSVTSIGEYVFAECEGLTSVTIPDSVTSIGEGAFEYCSGLTNVIFSGNAPIIDGDAFWSVASSCTVYVRKDSNGWGVEIPGTWQGMRIEYLDEGPQPIFTIENGVLTAVELNGATDVVIPDGVTSIGFSAFYNCSGLTSVTIPDPVVSINGSAFYGCSSLVNLAIGNGVTYIGGWAFSFCSNLTHVAISSNVADIGPGAFDYCSGLKSFSVSGDNPNFKSSSGLLLSKDGNTLVSVPAGLDVVEIPAGVTNIGGYAFAGCDKLMDIVIPDGVVVIGRGAFEACTGLLRVSVPHGVMTIPGYAFNGCSGITNLVISASVASIEECAFQDCSSLASVVIPGSVASVGYDAFYGCSGLTNVTFNGNAPTVGGYAFSGVDSGCTVYVRKNSTGWGVSIPGTWQGLKIEYLKDATELMIVESDTSVSAINAKASVNDRLYDVVVSDGATITVDAAFSSRIMSVSSTGSITLSAASQPNPDWFANVDFSGVQGALLRSWLTPGVVGFNFYNQRGSDTSGALAKGTWYSDESSYNGSSTALFADGLSTLTWASATAWSCSGNTIISGYLDDGAKNGYGAEVRLTGVPYETYDVIVYCSTDTSGQFLAKTVNGTTYTWDSAAGVVVEGNAEWGKTPFGAPIYGVNALRIKNLSGPLTIYGGARNGTSIIRGGIAAFQIMPTDTPDISHTFTSNDITYAYNCVDDGNAVQITAVLPDVIGAVTIPAAVDGMPVTNIGPYAFYGCSGLTTVTIPDSVVSIGEWAFYNCSGLTSVTIDDGVTSIGDYSFYNCRELTSVVIPDSVTNIGSDAYSCCIGLTSVTIPNSVTSIGSSAFSRCSGLAFALLPSHLNGSVSRNNQFYGCPTDLQIVYYNGSVDDLEWITVNFDPNGGAVGSSSRSILKGYAIGRMPRPSRVGCRFLGWFTAAEDGELVTAETVLNNAVALYAHWEPCEFDFDGDADWTQETDGLWKSGTITHSQKSSIIKTVSGKGTLSFEWKVSSESNYDWLTFYIDGVQMGRISGTNSNWTVKTYDVAEEGVHTFTWTYSKDNIVSSGLDCGWIREVAWAPDVPQPIFTIEDGVLTAVDLNGATEVTVPNYVTSIGDSAFSGCGELVSVVVPDSVTNIGYSVFAGCGSLTSMTLPFIGSRRGNTGTIDSLFGYVFGREAYTGGTQIQQVYNGNSSYCDFFFVPSTLRMVTITDETLVGYGAFYNCSWLTSVTLTDGVTAIRSNAFQNCKNLYGMTIPFGVVEIGSFAFSGCSGLMDISIPNTVTNILQGAFRDCSKLNDVTIPDGVTRIPKWIFQGCHSLTNVVIPNSVTSIEDAAFADCGMLMSFVVGGGNAEYASVNGLLLSKDGTKLIAGINGDVTIPGSVTSIGSCAFMGRSGLTSVTIPNSVTSIGSSAFWYCSGLTNIVFEGNAPEIGNDAFAEIDSNCAIYVRRGATGWGVDIPGTWQGMRIEYLDIDGSDLMIAEVSAWPTFVHIGDTVTVRYVEHNIGTTNAISPWVERIMLEGENGARTNLKTLSITEGLGIGQCVTNAVQAVIPDLVQLAGQVRIVVAANVNGDVEESNEGNNEGVSEWMTLEKKLYLTSASDSVKENVSGGVRFTVRRSGPVDESLTVSVGNADAASASVPATVTIPPGSVSTIFTVAPIDNSVVDGTRVVNVSVSADGFAGAFVPLTILDDEVPRLTVTLDKTSIREGDGVITATVTREGATDNDLAVYLSGTSGSRASYPSSVVIPAGATSVTFDISVPNNDTAQVVSELTIRASSSGYTSGAVTYTVEDDDVPGVVLTIAPEVVQEGAGASAAVMTLARVDTEDMSKAITVRLTASVANVLIMPKEVVIPANNPYVRQEIGVVDNSNVEADKEITITGAIVIPSCNCSAQPSSGGEIQAMLRIIDDDDLALKLRVEPLMMKEGQDVAGYIMVGQNTVLSENLAVSLYSDNDAEIELPPTVVIPAGETSVRVPVKTLNDGAEDGTVQVNIYAEADGYASDSKWVFVTDQNLPDLMPIGIEPQYATATAGESVSVSFVVTNIGYLTSKRSVPFSIYCVKGKSAIIEDAGILVFSGMTDGAVDIGASAEVSAIVTMPDITGDCRFAVVVDPDRLITELNDANNTAYSSVVSVSPSYIAEAQVEGERFLQGSAIEINGVAVKADGTTPAAHVEIEVYIIRDEFRRQLMATTDAQGRFVATFKPTSSEAGHYVVGASFPGMNATAEQDSFDILGMKRTSDAYLEFNNIPLGDEMSKTVYIRNMSPIDLTGISAEVVGTLFGCEIETSFADVLSGNATIPLTLTLRGTELTDGRDYKEFALRLTSAEGVTLDIPVLYFVQYQQAHIKASPASINTTMTVGQTRYVDFTIYNDGRGDSGKVTIHTSPFPWLSIDGGNEIANLASNESAIVTLKLTPGDDVELNNRYTGEIAVVCESRHGKVCVVPFAFKAVSEHTGTVKVDVIDGYTYHLPDAPHVSNATVRISNTYTGEIVASGRTGPDGTWVSGEIGEGKWQLSITADRHKTHYDIITVSPGMETVLPPIYLEAQTVTMSYSVTPTNIVDTYVVTLVTEYETAVPEPVLVTTFDDRIPNLQEGDEPFAFNAIIVNKGLVAVHGVYLEMPTIEGWEFTVGDSGFSLAPEESAVVPIIVRRPRKRTALMAAAGAVTVTKVDCVDVVRTRGYWYCGGDRRWHVYTVQLPTERVCTTTTYTIVPTEEEPRPPSKPGRIGGGGGGYSPGGGGSGTSRITISKTDCDPCANILDELNSKLRELGIDTAHAGRDEFISLSDVKDLLKDIFPFIDCVDVVVNSLASIPGIENLINAIQNNEVTRNFTGNYFRSYFKRGGFIKGAFAFFKDAVSCGLDAIGKVFKWAKVTIKTLFKLTDLVEYLDRLNTNAREGVDVIRRMNAKYDACLEKYADSLRDLSVAAGALEDYGDILKNILGDDISEYSAEDSLRFLMTFVSIIADDWYISDSQRDELKAQIGDVIPEITIDDWCGRWNEGIDRVANGDDSETTGFDIIVVFDRLGEIGIAEEYAKRRGHRSIQDMFEKSYEILINVGHSGTGNVCAKVTLELSQEVSMTREAFLGTLSVSNGHSSKPITDMEMELEITDENGERCEKLFQPENAGLVTMQGVSILAGGVSLAANSSGSANILFTPNTKAAQTVPKVYYFGGTVTYTDPFVGETVRVKLQPAVPVTVHPSPELTFHYFLQRDVIGDDPFTKDVVEESEPAEVALLILNKGYGDAENVTIKTAEPTITENEKELKVDFNWIGAALDGASTRLGYRNVDVGTVPAQGSRLAQWWLTSSLQGHFTKVDGSYTRLNSNGNPDFDLIKDVITHTLVRSIMADNDTLPDFLVAEGRFDGIPNFIYMDNGAIIDVSEATDATISGTGANVMLTVVPGATGWNYASCRHSLGTGLSISRVTRGDGSEVPLRNVWLTNRTFEDGVDPIVEDRIHIADEMAYGVASVYTIEFGGAAEAVDCPQVVGFFGVADQMDGNPAAIEVQFSCDIDATTFDVADLTLHHQGTAVADLSGLSISASGESGRFTISGFGNLGLGSGTYVLTVQASGVKDLSGISGTGSKSVMWTVVGDNTPPAQITDFAITPDGGYSDTDGITYTGELTVSGTLPESGLMVEIIAKYVGGGETVLATFDGEGAVATQFSQDITLPSSGNVTLVVRLTDAAGNSSDTEKGVFVDGIAPTGTLTGASEDEGEVTTTATLTLSDRVMDDDVALEKFSLTRDGEAVALEGVTLAARRDGSPYQWELSGLDSLCAEDGVYVLRFDGSAVRKYSSGLPMSGSIVMRWRYENPDREPPTVTEVLFDGETPHEAYTNGLLFSSVSVTFSEAVNVPELIEKGLIGRAARIDLLDAAGVVTGCVEAVAAGTAALHSWDADSNTLLWAIEPLVVTAGRARLILDAGLIKDLAGNKLAVDENGQAARSTNGMRTYTLSETVLAQVNAQAMPTWYNGELYVGEKTSDNKGKIRHYTQLSTLNSPLSTSWSYLQSDGVDIEIPAQGCQGASVAFADMDGDGVAETYVGTATGNVLKYPGGETIASLGTNRAMPYAYDIDGDGRDELVVGGMDGRIRIISLDEDSSTYSMTVLTDVNGAALTVPNGRAAPIVSDINHDGVADIVSGDTAGNVWAYLGEGTAWCAAPITVFTNNVSFADRSRLGYGDVNGDGVEDIIVGRSSGSVTAMFGAETPSPIVPFAVKAVVSASAGTHGAIAPVDDVTYDGGDTPKYTIMADVGYNVADVQIDGVSIGATNNYVFAPLTTSHEIHADFVTFPYVITYTGLNGAANTNPETYTVEDEITFSAPGKVYGWVFKGWTPASIALGSTGALEVTANWERAKFDVTVNGETTQYSYEDEVTFTAPEPWDADGMQVVTLGTTFTDPVVTNAFTVTVTNGIEFAWDIFATNWWFEVSETQNGSIAAPEAGWMADGTNFTLVAVPAEHYHFVGWTGDTNGCRLGETPRPTMAGGALEVTMDQARTIGATFAIDTFTVTFEAGAHGTLSGETAQTIDYGGTAAVPTVTPDAGYTFAGWSGDTAAPIVSNATFTAQYATIPYAITYAGLKEATNTNPETYTVEDEFTFTAPGEVYGWVFTGWTPASVARGSTGALEVTANWERAKFDVTVNGETRQYSYEDMAEFVTNAVINCGATQYVCKGWTATNADPGAGAGARAEFSVLGDVALNWLWETNVVNLAQSVNADGLDWTTGGASDWKPEWSDAANDGLHNAHSGAIGNNTNSWLETYVEGAGTLSFVWKSSTEARYDMFQFIVDGEVKGVISGETPWTTNSVVFGGGLHVIRWNYRKSRSGTGGNDTVWLDSVSWTQSPPPTLAEALNTNFVWTTYGDVEWEAMRSEYALEGGIMAIVDCLGDYEESTVATRVSGAGRITFRWAVSCEDGYDWLDFVVDGQTLAMTTGETDWKMVSVELGEGEHVLEWVYWKDEMDEEYLVGANCAMLDYVQWFPAGEEGVSIEEKALGEFYEWLKEHNQIDDSQGTDDALAMMTNGVQAPGKRLTLYEEFVVGTNPEDPSDNFTAKIEMLPDGTPKVTWEPDNEALRATRTYTTYGKKTLLDPDWMPVTDTSKNEYNFFKVEVKLK